MALRIVPACALASWIDDLAHQRVAEIRAMVIRVVIQRAVDRVYVNALLVPTYGKMRRRSAAFRRAVGVRLRAIVRGRDLTAQLEALITLLRNPEAEIARLARRLEGGLRDLAVFTAPKDERPLPARLIAQVCEANTS